MKLSWVLSRANELIQYPKTWRKNTRYIQCVDMIGLPCEAAPYNEAGG